jgi:hypothetical protein
LRHHGRAEHHDQHLAQQRRKHVRQRLRQHDVAEHLPPVQAERLRRLDLAARNRLDAGAHDLDRVGAEIDCHRQNRGLHLVDMNAEARQAEEHKEQLHDEWRIADQLDIRRNHRARPTRSGHGDAGAANAHESAQHGGHRGEPQGDGCTACKHADVDAEAAEIERITHDMPLIVNRTPSGNRSIRLIRT